MKKLHLEIITPEKVVFVDDVDTVIIPTPEGDIGILPDHAPLFTKTQAGEIMIRKEREQFYLAVTNGFVEVSRNQVNILADYAIRAEEIEEIKVEEARKRAQELMAKKRTEEEFAIARSELQRALLELKVAKRRRRIS